MEVSLHNACRCFGASIDVHVAVHFNVVLSAPSSNVLRLTTSMVFLADSGAVLCCAFTAALFWGAIGLVLIAYGKANWLEYLA